MTLKYLLEKEVKQFFRNPFLPKLMLVFPVMIILVVPWIMNMDIKNIAITVVDHDNSNASEKFAELLDRSSYFKLKGVTHSYASALDDLEMTRTDAIVTIPPDFEHGLVTAGIAPMHIVINAVNETKGTLGTSYLGSLCSRFSQEYISTYAGPTPTAAAAAMPKIDITVQNRYNPYMDYKIFMIPALMTIILILLGGFLPALNIVSEKEKGTIEQINITPVSKFTFIFAKLLPYWVMGLVVLSLTMLLAYLVYGLAPQGNIGIIYLFSLCFIFAISGFGLVVSNYSDTMQQAMFVMFFFILIFMLMSGLLSPLRSMPDWAQTISMLTPPRYYIEMMRMVYLKGATLPDLTTQLAALVGFDLLFGIWAVASYRKRN